MSKIRLSRNGRVYSDGEEISSENLLDYQDPTTNTQVNNPEDKSLPVIQLFGYNLSLTETLQITSVALQLLSIIITLIIACKLAKCK